MNASLLPIAFLVLLAQAAPITRLTEDLDGDGSVETVTAEMSDAAGRLRVLDAKGRLLAESAFPAPRAPRPRVALSAGSLGSAGALLAVDAVSGAVRCRSFWRSRDGVVSR